MFLKTFTRLPQENEIHVIIQGQMIETFTDMIKEELEEQDRCLCQEEKENKTSTSISRS